MRVRFPVRIVVGALALSACRRPGPETPDPHPPTELRPATPGLARYGDPVPKPPDSPEAAAVRELVTRIAQRRGQTPPTWDDRAAAVALDLARVRLSEANLDAALAFMTSHHGIPEPSPLLLSLRTTGLDAVEAAAELEKGLDANLARGDLNRLGAAAVRDGDATELRVVMLLSNVVLEPMPRAIRSAGTLDVRGRLAPGYGHPQVLSTDAAGRVAPAVVTETADGFAAQVRCGPDGRQLVAVEGDGPRGTTVVARFPVFCGTSPPDALALATQPPTPTPGTLGVSAAEAEALQLLNADRTLAGRPPLTAHAGAAAVARAHSEDMRDQHFVGHISPSTGGPGERAVKARLPRRLVLENVALAESPAGAQRGLMDSPGHRANILSPEVTHVGVGVAQGRGVGGQTEHYVTQLFLAIAPPLDADATRGRFSRELATLESDPALDAAATTAAADLARGRLQPGAVEGLAQRALDGQRARFVLLHTLVRTGPEPGDLGVADLGRFTHRGLGVAIGTDAAAGVETYFVVVLLATRRPT